LKRDLLKELPGILNWALDGLDQLKNRGRFEQPASAADEVAMLRDTGSPVAEFLEECVDLTDPEKLIGVPQDQQPMVLKDAVSAEFNRWHVRHGKTRVVGDGLFWKILKAACPGVRDYRPHGGQRFVTGITLK
jgi:putative DNA primase/helicase